MVLCLAILVIGCNKNSDVTQVVPGQKGEIKLNFTNMVGADPIILNSQSYTNFNGDTFYVNTFNYYISNIQFTRMDDSIVREENSYHLIEADKPQTFSFNCKRIPFGQYKSITFTIGVDSLRNVSGAQSGALDPVHNMFWSWSSGYLFTKLEGTSPQSPSGNIAFHIAGFSGPYNSLKTVTLNFPYNAIVSNYIKPVVKLKADILEMFVNPSTIKFGIVNNVTTVGALAKSMADNYADMFSVIEIEN